MDAAQIGAVRLASHPEAQQVAASTDRFSRLCIHSRIHV